MTYGFVAYNNNEEVLIDENFAVPKFTGKATFTPWKSGIMTQYSGLSYSLYYVDGRPPEGAPSIAFCTIPESTTQFYCPFEWQVETSSYSESIRVIYPTGAIPVLPEIYFFGTTNFNPSTDTWGLRIYRADGSVAFDSGNRHLALQQVSDAFQYPIYNVTTNYGQNEVANALSSLPAKPAFFLPGYGAEQWTNTPPSLGSTYIIANSAVRRSGSTIYTKVYKTENGFEDTIINGTILFGANSNLTLPVINAAIYD